MATKVQQMKQQAMRQKSAAKRALIRNPRVQFADWLKRTMPEVFEQAVAQADAQAELVAAKQAGIFDTGLGQWEDYTDPWAAPTTTTETRSWWEKFTDAIIPIGTSILTLKNQKDMLALNIERAKAGLPPLDPGMTAPVIRTQIDIDPELARRLASNVGSSINKGMLMFGAIAVVALFLFMRK